MDSRTVEAVVSFAAEPLMQLALRLWVLSILAVYLASIYWTVRDAEERVADRIVPYAWGSLALLPYLGVVLYLLFRPPGTLGEAHQAVRLRTARQGQLPGQRLRSRDRTTRDRTTRAGARARAA